MNTATEHYQLPRIRSLWLATTAETDFAPLSGNLSVDVAVIGAGIVGITSALILSEAGLRVALIEAERVAKGVSAYPSGKITSLHQVIYSYLISTFGQEKARQYAEANQSAIEKIASFVQEKKIPCDFVRKPAYTYAEKPEALEVVEKEVKAAQILGLPASFAGKVPLPFETQGAICLSNQAQFHPRKYLLALAKTIIDAGGQIYERTRALNIEEGEPCSIITGGGGIVKAREVIIASHTPFYDKAGFYSKRLFPMRTYMIAVRTQEPFPDGIFIGSDDFGHSLRSQQIDGSELVLIGGEDHPSDQVSNIDHYQALVSFANRIYPSPSIEYRWAGQYNETVDKVSYIGKFSSSSRHLFLATGFRGWGMTTGTAAAMILSDLILRGTSPWALVYDPAR
jgi:glycine/D-amino acid oxidase-like deaminating enzyme